MYTWLLRNLLCVISLGAACALFAGCNDDASDKPAGGAALAEDDPRAAKCEIAECVAQGRRCDPRQGCVDCLFDTDCAAGSVCDDRMCVEALSCVTDIDCAAPRPGCDPVFARCVECVADAHCAEGSRCKENKCQEVAACVNSRDCTGEQVCDREQGECVQCVANADCGEGFTCVDNSCETLCTSDKECASANQLCNTQLGYCSECERDVDCADVYHCLNGACELDVCEQEYSSCADFANGALSCSNTGDRLDFIQCPSGTSCLEETAAVTCAGWVCDPGYVACNSAGTALESCAADGLSVVDETACPEESVCVDDTCVPRACEPGSLFCSNNTLLNCSSSGLEGTLVLACEATQYCDSATAACPERVCTPGQVLCDGNTVVTCNENGAAFEEDKTECDADETCLAGACTPLLCEPGVAFCSDGDVHICDSTGAASVLSSSCSTQGRFCRQTDIGASCETVNCKDGDVRCNASDSGILVCNEATNRYEDGEDCEEGQACSEGECHPIVCEGNRQCKDGNVHQCSLNGTASTVYDTCTTSQFCRDSLTTATCAPDVCSPGTLGCNGNSTAKCAADGSGYVEKVTDCAATEQACVSGVCLDVICEPNTYFCSESGHVQRCGAQGVTSSLYDTCQSYEFCPPGESFCERDLCDAGEAICNGVNTAICKADGSGPDGAGTACAAGNACDPATNLCAPIVCEPDARTCDEALSRVLLCNETGTVQRTVTSCAASQYCGGDPVTCQADECVALAPACDGERPTTCDSFGAGPVAGGAACGATQVCTLDAEARCAAAAVDLAASSLYTGSSASGHARVNLYNVTTSRQLTEIQQYWTTTGSQIFHWLVYEADEQRGPYTLVLDSPAVLAPAAEMRSSGPISVALVAGKSYLIGAWVEGVSNYRYGSQNAVSFGELVGSYGNYPWVSTPPSIGSAGGGLYYTQTLTTTRPAAN